MVDVQLFAEIVFSNPTVLALMPVTATRSGSLPFPVGAVIGFKPSAPGRVALSCHSESVAPGKAGAATIGSLDALDLIWLSLKVSAADGANECDSGRLGGRIIGPLPRPGALSVAEVLRLDRAWGDALSLSAPSASNEGLGELAGTRAKEPPGSLEPPRLNLKRLAASGTQDSHHSHASIIHIMSGNASGGSEMIAEARWEHWTRQTSF